MMALMKPTPITWDVTRVLLAVVSLGALIATSLWVLRPFLPSAIWAVMIVIATWPEMRRVERWFRGRRGPAVAIMTLGMLAVIVVPIGVAVVFLIDRADEIAIWIHSLQGISLPPPPGWIAGLPVVGKWIAVRWQEIAALRPEEVAARVTPHLAGIVRWLIAQAGSLLALFVQLLVTLILAAFLYANGEAAAAWVRAFARRLAGGEGERAARLSGQAIRAIALGIVVTALVQSVAGGIGLVVTGVPHAPLLTAVMFLLGVAQIGAVPVLIGAVAWLYWQDQMLWGTVMLVWSVVTGTLDNFVRPILIKKGADLPLLLVFLGVVGGLLSFGIIGLFVGPVVLAVSHTLLMAWVEGRETGE
jgi:predicted PurR-regulated permease PerM